MRVWLLPLLFLICDSTLISSLKIAQTSQVPSASQQIAAALLPLPEVMREHATVLGYAADLSLVTLREGTNGMVCTASRPGDSQFDVRCYHQSFMPIVRSMRELHSRGVKQDEIYRTIDAEVKSKKLAIPDHPVAGYRMLGPISAFRAGDQYGRAGDRVLAIRSLPVQNRGGNRLA